MFEQWKEEHEFDRALQDWLNGNSEQEEAVSSEPVKMESFDQDKPQSEAKKTDDSKKDNTQKEDKPKDNKDSVPKYLQEVLDEYGITLKEYRPFEARMNSTYQLRKNYTYQEVCDFFVVNLTKSCERPLEDYELENIPHFANGYWSRWTLADQDEFYAGGEYAVIETEFRTLKEQEMPLEDIAKNLIKKYPYCPPNTMAELLKDGEAFLPFDPSDFYD